MALTTIEPRDTVTYTSYFNLSANSYTATNYRAAGSPANSTLDADTPRGVLGGSVAVITGDRQVSLGSVAVLAADSYATNLATSVLGLFGVGSEGGAFENNAAAAGGVVPIYKDGGTFTVYVFETHAEATPFASILAAYTVGAKLYCSPWGLLTNEAPSTFSGAWGTGVDVAVAEVVSPPSATKLAMDIVLLV